MTTPRSRKLQVTKSYRLFSRDNAENRLLNAKKHRRLFRSMQQYGFLPGWPIVCARGPDKKLVVLDGQHRLAFAEQLGLPVYWIEVDANFDIATINSTPVTWRPRDYAEKFAAQGKAAYGEGLEFATVHGLSIGTAFTLLAGTATFGNISEAFYGGKFVVKDRAWADAVAEIYGPLARLSPKVRNKRFIEALMAICRVQEFDSRRLLRGASRCADKLQSYGTRDPYLTVLEEIYNYGRKTLVPLKILALTAMRKRDPVKSKRRKAR